MSPLSGTVDMLASLQQRVAALEQQLGGDTLQPNVITVAADGSIGADFTGLVNALGVIVPAATSVATPEPQTNRIDWTRSSDGALVAEITGLTTTVSTVEENFTIARSYSTTAGGYSEAESQAIDSTGIVQAKLSANQGGGGVPAAQAYANAGGDNLRTIYNANGASSFLQLLSEQDLKLAFGSATAAVAGGWSNNTVNFHAALPQVNNMFPFYALEPLGVAHSIVSSEIGAFTTAGLTVNVNSSGAQNVGIYVFAVGGP